MNQYKCGLALDSHNCLLLVPRHTRGRDLTYAKRILLSELACELIISSDVDLVDKVKTVSIEVEEV